MEQSKLEMLQPTPSPKILKDVKSEDSKEFTFKMIKALPETPIIEVEYKEPKYVELDPDEPNLGRPKSFRTT